jgi:hypothetical protein
MGEGVDVTFSPHLRVAASAEQGLGEIRKGVKRMIKKNSKTYQN